MTDLTPPVRAPATDRLLKTLLASPSKVEEHARKGAALGITADDHAKLTYLFMRAHVSLTEFRGRTGGELSARIGEIWSQKTAGNA